MVASNTPPANLKGIECYWGRPFELVLGTIFGFLLGLPLIGALVLVVNSDNGDEGVEERIFELALSTVALVAACSYTAITLKYKQKRQKVWAGLLANQELTFFVLLPFLLYMGVAIAAQVTILYQAVLGYQYNKLQSGTEIPLPTYERGILIAQSVIYILNVIAQFMTILFHMAGFRGFSRAKLTIFFVGLCLGYLTSFNIVYFLVDINTTWSSNNARYDNVLVTAYISFRFFTACVFFNMAFTQPLKITEEGVEYHQQAQRLTLEDTESGLQHPASRQYDNAVVET